MQTEKEYEAARKNGTVMLHLIGGPPRSGKSTFARSYMKENNRVHVVIDADVARRSLARRRMYTLPYDSSNEHLVLPECMLHMEQSLDEYLHRVNHSEHYYVVFVDTALCETREARNKVTDAVASHTGMQVITTFQSLDVALDTCMCRVEKDNLYLAPVILRAAVRTAHDSFMTKAARFGCDDSALSELDSDVQMFCNWMDHHAYRLARKE